MLKIRIKKTHINNAIPRNSHRCMIADAIQQEIPDAKFICVDTQSIRFTNMRTGKRNIYLTPPSAQKALIQFDSGSPVKPFSFTMSRGYSRLMRVKAGKVNRSKHYKRTGTRYMPKIVREFGLRSLGKIAA